MLLEGPLAAAWAIRDLEAASAWAQRIADPAGRAAAVSGVLRYWVGADPDSAQEWVLGLPQDDTRQRAAGQLVMEATFLSYELEPETVRAYGIEAEPQDVISGYVRDVTN